jgi:hypothetical protein
VPGGDHVTLDGRNDGLITQGWWRAVRVGDDGEVPLRHPIEHHDLASTGYTMLGASLRGCLLLVEHVLCKSCGVVGERRSITFELGGLGCLVFFVGPVLTAILFHRLPLPAQIAIGLLSGVVVLWAHPAATRVIYRRRQRGLALGACGGCGRDAWITVERAEGKTLPCPGCKRRSLRIEAAGMS